MNLPQYQSHKIVNAAKIVAIDHNERLDLMPHGVVEVGFDWIREKHAHVGGYYVVYNDGYASFSPAEAFEDGYTPVVVLTEGDAAADLTGTPRPDNPSPKITGYRNLSDREIDMVNVIKAFGRAAEEAIANVNMTIADQRHKAKGNGAETTRIDAAQPERWTAIARTHFQEGLMALTRAIAQPSSF